MAITIDWGTSIINVPRADMIVVQSSPVEVRQLNIDDFRKSLNDLQDNEDGMPFPTTHNHVAPISVGGVDLARVVEILDPYTITFEDGQYAVNLVGANSNIADKTNVNQVSVRSANSAGLPDLTALQSAGFGGVVTVRAGSIYSGTTYPVGLRAYPVNNIADARLIAEQWSLSGIQILGDYTFDTGDDISYFTVYGQNAGLSTFTINSGADTTGAQIIDATISGNLDGGATIERCVLNNLNYINGFVYKCMLNPGTITLGGMTTAHFLNCYSGVPGTGTPTIDMNGVGDTENTALAMRGYNGGIRLIDKTGPAAVSIDLASGQVKIADSCTAGQVVVRGDGKVIDDFGNHLYSGTINGGLELLNETNFSAGQLLMKKVLTVAKFLALK